MNNRIGDNHWEVMTRVELVPTTERGELDDPGLVEGAIFGLRCVARYADIFAGPWEDIQVHAWRADLQQAPREEVVTVLEVDGLTEEAFLSHQLQTANNWTFVTSSWNQNALKIKELLPEERFFDLRSPEDVDDLLTRVRLLASI